MSLYLYLLCASCIVCLFHDVKKKNANLWIIQTTVTNTRKEIVNLRNIVFTFLRYLFVMFFFMVHAFFIYYYMSVWNCNICTWNWFTFLFLYSTANKSNVSVSMLNDTVWTWGSFSHGASVVTDETRWHHDGVMCLRMVCPHPHLPAHCQWIARATK